MASLEDKENLAPQRSSESLQRKGGTPSQRKNTRKGRSKSIGPGGLDEPEPTKEDSKDTKNRRKSTYVAATKSIISNDTEKAQRQAARRKTLANRRVSFAPEATLHTWDVIEFMRDPTTSTDASENTRRASGITRSSAGSSPLSQDHAPGSDPPSDPSEQADESNEEASSPQHQRELHQRKQRRSSGIPPMNFNNPDDAFSSDGPGNSSEVSGSEEESMEMEDWDSDDTGTAMSMDVDDNTVQSAAESDSSTGSSARLEAALRQAASTAGTRGIDYDEYGDESVSMEIAGEEITNAFKPWAGQRAGEEAVGSASMDQENVNPFSPAFKEQLSSGPVSRPATVEEEDTGDMTMDVTRPMGGIVNQQPSQQSSSPLGDGTMDFTQAVGEIQGSAQAHSPNTRGGQKRRRSTNENGSPGGPMSAAQSKRRRSSVARSSMGDDTMDLTMPLGSIQSTEPPMKQDRRRSAAKRHSVDAQSEPDEATMEFTQAVGGIKPVAAQDPTVSSLDENEELTMEFTAVLGGIKAGQKAQGEARPVTPAEPQSPAQSAANTTPKDQARFKDAPEEGAVKLLTPLFEKQAFLSAEKNSGGRSQNSSSPAKRTRRSIAFKEPSRETTVSPVRSSSGQDQGASGSKTASNKPSPNYPELPPLQHSSTLRRTPVRSPSREQRVTTPQSSLKQQLDAQSQDPEASPTAQKQQRSSPSHVRSSPMKAPSSPARAPSSPLKGSTPQPNMPSTPEQGSEQAQDDSRRLVDSIKLMTTPRKETLKNVTPKKQTPAPRATPQKMPTPRARPTPKGKASISASSPARQLNEDIAGLRSAGRPPEKIRLQQFLDQAGIRFMDLTATKRRLTTATTPSKARQADGNLTLPAPDSISLETAILAGGCTLPELEMFEHACHELKRYISDGRKVIRELEADAARETPPMLLAYPAAGSERRAVLDAQMRDIKTQARLRSKEMWYAWRGQLMEDLMKALQGIAEGMVKDDEILRAVEDAVDAALPGLVQKEELEAEKGRLEREAASTSAEEKEELDEARERLISIDEEMTEKRARLKALQREAREQDHEAEELEETRAEFQGAIAEAEKVKEACRGVSTADLTALTDSINKVVETHNWALSTATSHPPTLTLTHANALTLFLHPAAFTTPGAPNASVSLTHTVHPTSALPTLQRFFLQHARAVLQALPQSETPLPSVLRFVAATWALAGDVAEQARRVGLLAPVEVSILADDVVGVEAVVLVPRVRAKVKVGFEVRVEGQGESGLDVGVQVGVKVGRVYGGGGVESVGWDIEGVEGWADAVKAVKGRMEEESLGASKRGNGALRR